MIFLFFVALSATWRRSPLGHTKDKWWNRELTLQYKLKCYLNPWITHWALALVKGIREPHEVKKKSFDLGGNRAHDLRIRSTATTFICTHTKDRRESRNLSRLFAKSCWNINKGTMSWICKIYFLFVWLVFIRVGFETNNKYAKKVLSQPRNSLTLQLSLSLRGKHDKIVILAEATAFLVLRVFFIILDNPRPTLNHANCSVYSPNVVET